MRDGFHRLGVEKEAKRIGVVHGDVEDHAAAGFRLVQPPSLQMRRQIDGMEHPREERPADGAARAISSRILRCVAALRRWWFVPITTPASAQAATISMASSTFRASGFSQSTCLPAFAAASAWGDAARWWC